MKIAFNTATRSSQPQSDHGRTRPGGVHDPGRVGPQVGADGEQPDDVLEQRDRGPQSLVVAGFLRQIRESTGQVTGQDRSQRACSSGHRS